MADRRDGEDIKRLCATSHTRRRFLRSAVVSSGLAVPGVQAGEGARPRTNTHRRLPGGVAWQFDTNGEVHSSPTVVDNVVYIGSGIDQSGGYDNRLYALELTTGDPVWDFQTGGPVLSSPNVVDDIVFVGSRDGFLYAIGADTETQRWRFQTDGPIHSSPTVFDGLVYVASQDGTLYALETDEGDLAWEFPTGDRIDFSSPTVVSDLVYIGSHDGHLYAIDARTGEVEWRFEARGVVDSSPTVVDGTVVFASDDEHVYGLDADTGDDVWSQAIGEANNGASPTVFDGLVYIQGSRGTLFAIDATDGSVEFRIDGATAGLPSRPTIVDGLLYTLSEEFVTVFDAISGADEGLIQIGEIGRSSPVVVDDHLVVGDRTGVVSGIEIDHSGSSQDSSVELGTLGHHHVWAESTTTHRREAFSVEIVQAPGSIDAGEDLDVSFTVTNTGEQSATQTVTVELDGEVRETLDLSVAAGESRTESVTLSTETLDGEVSLVVASANDEEERTISVAGAVADGQQDEGAVDEDDDEAGLIGTPELTAIGGGLFAIIGGYVLLRRRREDDDQPRPTPATERATDATKADTATGDEFTLEGTVAEIEAHLENARANRDDNEYDEAIEACNRAKDVIAELRETASVKAPHRVPEIDPHEEAADSLHAELVAERDTYRDAWESVQSAGSRLESTVSDVDPADPDDAVETIRGIESRLNHLDRDLDSDTFPELGARIGALISECETQRERLESAEEAYESAIENLDSLESALETVADRLAESDDSEEETYGPALQQLDDIDDALADVIADVDATLADFGTSDLDERIVDVTRRAEELREKAAGARDPIAGVPASIPGTPDVSIDYGDIQRVEPIGTGGNADVYRARVPTGSGKTIDVAIKEPRMGGILHEGTQAQPPPGDERTPADEDSKDADASEGSDGFEADVAFEEPDVSATATDPAVEEHEPGETGTRAWDRDEDIDPDQTFSEIETPEPQTTDPAGAPTEIRPGGEGYADDMETKSADETTNELIEEAEKWEKIDDHDHIVDVIDYGQTPVPWIAMEYMDGGHIGHRGGRMDLDQALWTAIAISKAVRHAHRRGVAHLDLKPDNILFRTVEDAWDVPKVADWGLSKLLLNHSQSVAGLSTHYAAPEQFDRSFGQADDITDVYQLGAVFYELFTGQKPFDGRPAEVMRKVLNNEVTPPSEVANLPDALDEILMNALALEKDDRYETVIYLRDDLQDLRESL